MNRGEWIVVEALSASAAEALEVVAADRLDCRDRMQPKRQGNEGGAQATVACGASTAAGAAAAPLNIARSPRSRRAVIVEGIASAGTGLLMR